MKKRPAKDRKLCVDIAKDVLLQFRNKRYRVEAGTYCFVDVDDDGMYYSSDEGLTYNPDFIFAERKVIAGPNESFQKVFKEQKKIRCYVCALGAVFVSYVNLKNECSLAKIQRVDFGKLAKIFGKQNIILMETAFEGSQIDHYEDFELEEELADAACKFGARYSRPKNRLRAIMQNVIHNGGDFVISARKSRAKSSVKHS